MTRPRTFLQFVFPVSFALLVWFNFFITREGISLMGHSEMVVRDVPVMVLYEPPMLLLATVAPERVAVMVSGEPHRVQSVSPEDVRAFVSVEKGLEAGTYDIFLQVLPPKGVTVVSIDPAQVTVSLSAVSEVPRLRPSVNGEAPAPGVAPPVD